MNSELKQSILSLLDKGTREDERKLDEYRDIKIETNISKNAEGSAKVTMGETQLIAGVKLALGTPYADSPNEGNIMVGAEFLPMASPDFETGPPSVESIELSRVVDRGIRESKTIDLKKLCITPGEKVWMLFIDIYIINNAGNLQDASFLAAMAALKNAKFPKLDGDKVNYEEHTDVSIPLLKEPIECTVHKINNHFIVDPSINEQKVSDSTLIVAVTKDEKICAMQKTRR